MNRNIQLLTLILFFFFSINLIGQNEGEIGLPQEEGNLVAVGLTTGTKSMWGFDVAFKLAPNLTLSVAYNHLHFDIRDFETNFGRFEHYVTLNGDMRMSSYELLVERKIRIPFTQKYVRGVAGVAYFPLNKMYGDGAARDTFPFFDIPLTPGEIGYVGGTLSYRSNFSPYIGIAFGRAIPRKKFGFSFNLGTYYKGRPTVDIEGSNILRNIDRFDNEEKIENGISSYRWWPVLSFRLAYKLNPVTKRQNPVAIMSKGESKSKGGKEK